MEWVRGDTVGRGCFGKVDLAIVSKANNVDVPSLMAVKSAPVYNSESLKHEREILGLLGDSENVIRCFGDSCSLENGEKVYNLFLEYAAEGSLFDKVMNCGGSGLGESEVRCYTTSLLRGLNEVHSNGFVHCDVKLQNILLCSGNNSEQNGVVAKIADFGLAKRQSTQKNRVRYEFRGTPLYMAPETALCGEMESAADIWAVGCAVLEMLTCTPVWRNETNIASLMLKISSQLPELPSNLSSEVRDFLEKCFIRDTRNRWTAEMLLGHEFIAAAEALMSKSSDVATISPRCPLDFPEFYTPTPNSVYGFDSWNKKDEDCTEFSMLSESSLADRFRQLVSDQVANWVLTDSWLMVR